MDNDKTIEEFRRRLSAFYSAYIGALYAHSRDSLIERAEKIAATKTLYNELMSGKYDPLFTDALTGISLPLDALRDEWMKNRSYDPTADIRCAIAAVTAQQSDCELDPAYAERREGQEMC